MPELPEVETVQHIARDPFDSEFKRNEVVANFRKRKIRIKSALLNQEIMSGVGNIYANETLWRAKIHPEQLTCDLSRKKVESVIQSAIEVMGQRSSHFCPRCQRL